MTNVMAFVLGLCLLSISSGVAQQPAAASPGLPAQKRLVAIGDLHADLDNARRAFRLAGAIDERDAWIGGPLTIVQMGDLIGRGSQDREVLEFVLALQTKAAAAGGTLHVILGNHEVFAARPDHRWVAPDAFAAFDGIPKLNLRDPRVLALPVPERSRFAALMPGSAFATRIATFPAVLKIGDIVFAHGGVLPLWAEYGIDRLNADVRAWLMGKSADEPRATSGLDDGSGDDGVMWSRHFAAAPESIACPLATESLDRLKARRMVVAHTVLKSITSRCDDRIWAIDVGISRYYGGDLQALELISGRAPRIMSPAGP